ncbi:RcpC/CpaB family pilus assembly protein [Streptomyces sp. BBFR102]|uniref:RcpC/CpaB family pilus assembly protein n=1 Tax=Streptomyces sp. BBFR102 TaxID=3448171 RepID=UPI003F53E53B
MAGLLVGVAGWAMPGVGTERDASGGEAAAGVQASASAEAAGARGGASSGSGAGSDSDARYVAAPVRLADGGVVGFLRAGDRVDVLAAGPDGDGGRPGRKARRIASCAQVLRVPGTPAPEGTREEDPGEEEARGEAPWPEFGTPGGSRDGLVLLRVRRSTAEALAGAEMGAQASPGAGAGSHLVVAVC